MKARLLAVAGLVTFGLIAVPFAEAAAAKPRHHVVRKSSAKKNSQPGGVSVDSQDLDGDGTPDTVVAAPPKPKPKKH